MACIIFLKYVQDFLASLFLCISGKMAATLKNKKTKDYLCISQLCSKYSILEVKIKPILANVCVR